MKLVLRNGLEVQWFESSIELTWSTSLGVLLGLNPSWPSKTSSFRLFLVGKAAVHELLSTIEDDDDAAAVVLERKRRDLVLVTNFHVRLTDLYLILDDDDGLDFLTVSCLPRSSFASCLRLFSAGFLLLASLSSVRPMLEVKNLR